MPAIDLVGEVDLVGAAAIVIGAAGADREPQRHRLQRARLVAGNLQTLDLRRKRQRVVSDRLRRAAAAFRQQIADALPTTDQIDGAQQRSAVAEDEPRLIEQAALDALHGEGDRAAGADRVDAELVAALRRAQDGVAVADAAE